MTKRNFKPPTLTNKNKWSENFHDFLRAALQKDPRRRPSAAELLRVSFTMYVRMCMYVHRLELEERLGEVAGFHPEMFLRGN